MLKKIYPILFIAALVLVVASLLSIISDQFPHPLVDQKTIELLQHVFPEASNYQYN